MIIASNEDFVNILLLFKIGVGNFRIEKKIFF